VVLGLGRDCSSSKTWYGSKAELPPTGTKKIPDFSLTVKQFSLTLQDDYSGHESTKIRMAQTIFKTKLPYLYKNI